MQAGRDILKAVSTEGRRLAYTSGAGRDTSCLDMIGEFLYFGLRFGIFLIMILVWFVVLDRRPAPEHLYDEVADQVQEISGIELPPIPINFRSENE